MHGRKWRRTRFVQDIKSSILVCAGFEILAGHFGGQDQLSGEGTLCQGIYVVVSSWSHEAFKQGLTDTSLGYRRGLTCIPGELGLVACQPRWCLNLGFCCIFV